PEAPISMPEVGALVPFGSSALALAPVIFTKIPVEDLFERRKILVAVSVIGTIGSFLYLLSDFCQSWPILVIGGLLGGTFMSVYGLGWGAVYCTNGARSATPYVAGGFACAILIDTPLLFMVPQASAFFFAPLPLASGLAFITIDPRNRSYRHAGTAAQPPMRGLSSRLKNYLGLSLTLLGGMVLVMVGFGYTQHLMSFVSVSRGKRER
ncbi:MAG: LuxR family transcriptional regulator, partial [Raoultibacter sp.]